MDVVNFREFSKIKTAQDLNNTTNNNRKKKKKSKIKIKIYISTFSID